MKTGEQLQQDYYTATAVRYDDMHGNAREHNVALGYMLAIANLLKAKSILDVGSGTGRAVKVFLREGFMVRGVEPVPALAQQAVEKHGIPPGMIVKGRGEALPFPDASFDVVCETGMLHHVPQPNDVVREMIRVARLAVFLSDENRFGLGNTLSGAVHFLLHKCRLGPLYRYVRTFGKGYTVCPEDGIRYSYSVYESFSLLAGWADRVFMIPTKSSKAKPKSWFHPLFTASHVLCCAVREGQA
jgi:ubiquinone/menaquinone biosynthesis C-methylase UbiE